MCPLSPRLTSQQGSHTRSSSASPSFVHWPRYREETPTSSRAHQSIPSDEVRAPIIDAFSPFSVDFAPDCIRSKTPPCDRQKLDSKLFESDDPWQTNTGIGNSENFTLDNAVELFPDLF